MSHPRLSDSDTARQTKRLKESPAPPLSSSAPPHLQFFNCQLLVEELTAMLAVRDVQLLYRLAPADSRAAKHKWFFRQNDPSDFYNVPTEGPPPDGGVAPSAVLSAIYTDDLFIVAECAARSGFHLVKSRPRHTFIPMTRCLRPEDRRKYLVTPPADLDSTRVIRLEYHVYTVVRLTNKKGPPASLDLSATRFLVYPAFWRVVAPAEYLEDAPLVMAFAPNQAAKAKDDREFILHDLYRRADTKSYRHADDAPLPFIRAAFRSACWHCWDLHGLRAYLAERPNGLSGCENLAGFLVRRALETNDVALIKLFLTYHRNRPTGLEEYLASLSEYYVTLQNPIYWSVLQHILHWLPPSFNEKFPKELLSSLVDIEKADGLMCMWGDKYNFLCVSVAVTRRDIPMLKRAMAKVTMFDNSIINADNSADDAAVVEWCDRHSIIAKMGYDISLCFDLSIIQERHSRRKGWKQKRDVDPRDVLTYLLDNVPFSAKCVFEIFELCVDVTQQCPVAPVFVKHLHKRDPEWANKVIEYIVTLALTQKKVQPSDSMMPYVAEAIALLPEYPKKATTKALVDKLKLIYARFDYAHITTYLNSEMLEILLRHSEETFADWPAKFWALMCTTHPTLFFPRLEYVIATVGKSNAFREEVHAMVIGMDYRRSTFEALKYMDEQGWLQDYVSVMEIADRMLEVKNVSAYEWLSSKYDLTDNPFTTLMGIEDSSPL